jgi:hypothetical protein
LDCSGTLRRLQDGGNLSLMRPNSTCCSVGCRWEQHTGRMERVGRAGGTWPGMS